MTYSDMIFSIIPQAQLFDMNLFNYDRKERRVRASTICPLIVKK